MRVTRKVKKISDRYEADVRANLSRFLSAGDLTGTGHLEETGNLGSAGKPGDTGTLQSTGRFVIRWAGLGFQHDSARSFVHSRC
jgi:hypothetical protein